MAMPLNIKDPEAYRLASDIARHTGKSLTRVVVDALRREREALKPASLEIDMERVRAILVRLDSGPAADRSVSAVLNELYDERGLPR
ncbi:MAG: type II toxin-antitoxin system VapB family antitoxin [Bryobacterales bacterium]|nr:type II toxin-antitoxin system VapB family antitoxin [Bryobacterales bacterium]